MKRAVGILLILLAFACATVGLCGVNALLLTVLRPELGRLLEPALEWIAQGLGIDPTDLAFIPCALACAALGMGAAGQQLLGRTRPLRFMQSDALDRTAA